MSNLIRMGIKVALAVFSSYTNDDIDRIDKVSPTQVITEKGCEDYTKIFICKEDREIKLLVWSYFHIIIYFIIGNIRHRHKCGNRKRESTRSCRYGETSNRRKFATKIMIWNARDNFSIVFHIVSISNGIAKHLFISGDKSPRYISGGSRNINYQLATDTLNTSTDIILIAILF